MSYPSKAMACGAFGGNLRRLCAFSSAVRNWMAVSEGAQFKDLETCLKRGSIDLPSESSKSTKGYSSKSLRTMSGLRHR